jgi:hypothetical protein
MFGCRRGRGTRDAIVMLRIISKQTLEKDDKLSIFVIDWQNGFDRVKWTRSMQNLKKTGADWCE